MRGPAIVDWLDRLDAELDNLGTALEWGLEAEPWTAVRHGDGPAPLLGRPGHVPGQRRPDRRGDRDRPGSGPRTDPTPGPRTRRSRPSCWARGRACGACPGVRPSRSAGPRTPCASPTRAATPPARLAAHGRPRRSRSSSRDGRVRTARTCGRSSRVARTSPRRSASGGSSRWRRGSRAPVSAASTRTAERPSCSAASRRHDGPGARMRSAPCRWRRVGCSGARARPTPLWPPSAWRSSASWSSATNGSCSPHGATWRTPCDAAGGSTRRSPCTARPSAAGSTSATRERSRTSSRTSRTSTSERGRTELAVRLLGAADALREAADARMAFDEEPEYIASLERLRAALMTGGVRERLGDRSRAVPGRRRRARSRRLTPTMPSQLLDTLPVPLVFVAFAIVTMICYEVGFRLGRWWQVRTPGEQEGPTGMLVGSILALLAFLLAVTMGMAADRFDARRSLVLAEANAIGTAYLRAGYLPEPASSQARELLRQYVPLRIVSRCGRPPGRHRSVERDPRQAMDRDRGRGQDGRLRRRRDLRRIGQRDDRYPREPGHGGHLLASPRDGPAPAHRRCRAEPRHGRLQRRPDRTTEPAQRRRARRSPWARSS